MFKYEIQMALKKPLGAGVSGMLLAFFCPFMKGIE